MAIGCVICTEEFSLTTHLEKNPAVLKNCGHVFHDVCLKMWLKKSHTCPICRTPAMDSPAFIGKLHLQRLSLDNNLTVNNLLDENIDLRNKLAEKDEEIQRKDGELKRMEKQLADIRPSSIDTSIINDQIKFLEDWLSNMKKMIADKAALPSSLRQDEVSDSSVGSCSGVTNPERHSMIRNIRSSSVSSRGQSNGIRPSVGIRGNTRVALRGRSASSSVLNVARRD